MTATIGQILSLTPQWSGKQWRVVTRQGVAPEIICLDDPEAEIPTFAEIEAERARVEAELDAAVDAEVARKTARAALRAQWEALPDFIRGPYRPVFDAANQLLDAGDDDGALAMIQYEEPRSAFSAEQVAIFDQVKASFLSAIEQLPAL